MKLRVFVVPAIGLVLVMVACRGLIGIEELQLDAGTDGSQSASGGPTDATTDATVDATSVADGGTDAPPPGTVCEAGPDCRMCCKNTYALHDLELAERPCFCDAGGACTAQCLTDSYCMNGQLGPPGQSCAPCIDDSFSKGVCTEACKSAGCQAGLACLHACP